MLDLRSAEHGDDPKRSWSASLHERARAVTGSLGRRLRQLACALAGPRRRPRTVTTNAASELADAALAGEATPALASRIARLASELSSARACCVYSRGSRGLALLGTSRETDGAVAYRLAAESIQRGEEVWHHDRVAIPLRSGELLVGALTLDLQQPGQDLGPLAGLLTSAGSVLAAAEREARKDRFLSLAAHELKTPLTSIKGFSYSLSRRLSRGEACDPRAVQVLERQAERLHGLLEEMLEVSRLETGRFVLHQEACELGELLDSAQRSLRRLGADTGLVIRSEPFLPLVADRERIERSLVALVLKARTLGPPVLLEAARAGDRAIIRATWSGAQLGNSEREQAFAAMWEAPQHERVGLGMALLVAQEVSRLHGGTLRAEPQSLVLELPLRVAVLGDASKRRGGRILIVDDDEPLASMLAEFLCESGYVADWAAGGRAALEKLALSSCDLLVLDLRMPDLDGRSLLEELRGRLGLNPRVVLLSADREVARAAQELGAEAFVEKPFAPESLLAAVARALQRSSADRP